MKNFLEKIVAFVVGRGKKDIRGRVARLVMFGGSVSCVFILLLSFYGIFSAEKIFVDGGKLTGEKTGEYIRYEIEEDAKEVLSALAEIGAESIYEELGNFGNQTAFLARKMTDIMTHPENYKPRVLPRTSEKFIVSHEPYVHYSTDAERKFGNDEKVWNEIRLASNIADTLLPFSDVYSAAFVGSKNGWLVGIYNMTDIAIFSGEYMNNYFPSQRIWYALAEKTANPEHKDVFTFTDIYKSVKGNYCITSAAPYYDANGFAGVVGLDCDPKIIYEQFKRLSVKTAEAFFVLDDAGAVMFSSGDIGVIKASAEHKDIRDCDEPSLADVAKLMVEKQNGVRPVKIDGNDYFIAFAPLTKDNDFGWSFAVLAKREAITAPAIETQNMIFNRFNNFVASAREDFANLMKLFLLVTVLDIALLFYLSRRLAKTFVKPVEVLTEGVDEIANGNLDKELVVMTKDEMGHLAAGFDVMRMGIKENMTKIVEEVGAKEKLATQLDVATEIQTGMLPNVFPTDKGFEIFATMHAAKEVGGDFYDFYMTDENKVVVTVADVSGKGIAAALFMVISKTVLNNFARLMTSPEDLAAAVACTNEKLCENNEAFMFVTAFVGVLDLTTGKFTYVNAGHNPPLVYRRAKNTVEYIKLEKSYPLGVNTRSVYETRELMLEAGDFVFMYTDGVTEAMDPEGNQYTPERLEDCMKGIDAGDMSLEEVLAAVRKSLDAHVKDAEQSDDITMIAVRMRRGKFDESGKGV